MPVRIADDFAAIREAMLQLRPKAPAIVHAQNLMPISTALVPADRYETLITYRAFSPLPPQPGMMQTYAYTAIPLWDNHEVLRKALATGADIVYQQTPSLRRGSSRAMTDDGLARPAASTTKPYFPKLSSPRMTLAEIERWNSLRAHTGMVMRPVLRDA